MKEVTAFLGVSLLAGIGFFPVRTSAQTGKIFCEKKQKTYDLLFNNPVPNNLFLTRAFLDFYSETNKEKLFNGTKFDLVLTKEPSSLTENFSFDFYLTDYKQNPLSFYLGPEGNNIVSASDSTEDLIYSKMYRLYRQGIIQKKGLKNAGVWGKSKRAYRKG